MTARDKHLITMKGAGWASKPGVPLPGLAPVPQHWDVFYLCFEVDRKRNPGNADKELAVGLWCSPSQAVDRLRM